MPSSIDLEMMQILLEEVKPNPNSDHLYKAIISFSKEHGIATEAEISKHFGIGIKTTRLRVARPEIYKWLLGKVKSLQKNQK